MKQRQPWLSRERLNEFVLFLLLLMCYSYTFPRWADPNQNSRLDMVVAVVEDGTFQIDKYVDNTVDYAKVGEHYYSDKAPGAAFLGIPIYAGLKFFLDLPLIDGLMDRLANNEAFQATLRQDGSGIFKQKVRFALAQVALTFVVSVIPSAILGVLLYRLLAHFTAMVWPRLMLVLGYGLLTPAFAYASAFYGHQLSTAMLFGAFYLVFRMGESGNGRIGEWANGRIAPANEPVNRSAKQEIQGSKPNFPALFAVGLLLGYSVVTEYPTLLMVAILYLYTLYTLMRPFVKGSSLSAVYRLPSTVYRQIGWVTLAGAIVAVSWMGYNTAIFGGPLELGYSHSELWQDQHQTGFMSLTLPRWEATWGITFSLFRGLFILAPWLLLSIPGFWLWWRSGQYRAEFWVALTSVGAIFMFNASSIMWWGGFAIGPRYLLPMLPFMVLPIIFVLKAWGSQIWLWTAGGFLFAWSFIATWGLTLAEQAFPSDTIRNPLLHYAWPNWQAGNIARNFGTVLGLPGLWSLLPLIVLLTLIGIIWWLLARRAESGSPAGAIGWTSSGQGFAKSGR